MQVKPTIHSVCRGLIYFAAVIIFSLLVRLTHHRLAEPVNALQGDMRQYLYAANNLKTYGVYSLEPPGQSKPASRTDLPFGYPLFLFSFMNPGKSLPEIYESIRFTQMLLGVAIVAMVFIFAAAILGPKWAGLAALLTALSPNLIVMDNYVLTETYFTFIVMLGILTFLFSWRFKRVFFIFCAGFFLFFSSQVRVVTYLLMPFLSWLYLFDAQKFTLNGRKFCVRAAVAVVLAFLSVFFMHRIFIDTAVGQASRIGYKYTGAGRLAGALAGSLRPPQFMVEGRSHVLGPEASLRLKRPTQEPFKDNIAPYLKWNMGGKIFFLWNFHNIYSGNPYIYPVSRQAFTENIFLKVIYYLMYLLHWPLFFLSAAACFLFVIKLKAGTLSERERLLAVPVLFFIYFLGVLICMGSWIPRYTIPLRPVSYVLAVTALVWLVKAAGIARRKRGLYRG